MNEEITIYYDINEMKIGNKIIYDVDKDILNYIKYLEQRVEQLENIRKEAYEFVEWHYKDNKEFFKNKGIGLNYPECDYLLNILNKGSE